MPAQDDDMNFECASAHLSYSAATGQLVWRGIQKFYLKGREAGAIEAGGYRVIKIKGRTFKAHRLAWLLHYGEWPSQRIDHIDGDKSNNRVNNLRLATQQQNMMNQRPKATNLNGYKGITYQKSHQSWLAQLTVAGKNLNLGRYKDPADAARAYDAKAKELFGEFAYQNFPAKMPFHVSGSKP